MKSLIRRESQQYLSADIAPGLADVVLDIEKIDMPECSWDMVVASHVLEHVNDRRALKEIRRILRPNGILLAMVPICEGWDTTYENEEISTSALRQLHFGQWDHIRYYGRDFASLLREAGFVVRTFTASGQDSATYGLIRGEKIFVCNKSSHDVGPLDDGNGQSSDTMTKPCIVVHGKGLWQP